MPFPRTSTRGPMSTVSHCPDRAFRMPAIRQFETTALSAALPISGVKYATVTLPMWVRFSPQFPASKPGSSGFL